MSYNDRFVIVCCDSFVIVKNSVLKLHGEFIKPLEDVRLIAITEEAAKCRGFPVGETSRSRCSRSAGPLGCHTRIRAGFPRERSVDRSMARDRPSPYGEGGRAAAKKPPGYRSAGDRPPRALECANDIETRRSLLPGGMETRRAERFTKHLHSKIVPSKLALARSVPSGEKASP